MGLFSPYKRNEPVAAPPEPEAVEPAPVGKGPAKKEAPTPTRREAEQARRDRVNPQLSPKEAKARDRKASREARIRAMEQSDKTPARSLARDFIDSSWGVGEWVMPLLLVTVVLALIAQSFVQPATAAALMSVALVLSYGVLMVTIVEIVLRWRQFKKLLQQRLPSEGSKGLLFYFVNRWISVRALRQPKPLYRRGEKLR